MMNYSILKRPVCGPAFLAAAGALCLAGTLPAQRDTASGASRVAQQATVAGPAIRRISTASALSTEALGTIGSVRGLSDGRVLVNDVARRRLLLMDSSMKTVAVVLDSLTEVANSYGLRAGVLIAYRGDSSLFFDLASYAMLVLDPSGQITRVRSLPRVRDAVWIGNPNNYGYPGIDARGRLVYRVQADPTPPAIAPPKGVPWFPQDPDSAFVVAIDFDTRALDTLGAIRTPKSPFTVKRASFGFNFMSVTNPIPTGDEWSVLSDGTIAFLRWRDYRVEYRVADGAITSSPKLPYDWQHLVDEDKQRITDSVANVQRRQSVNAYVSAMIRWVNLYKQQYPSEFKIPAGYAPTNGFPRDWKLPAGIKLPPNYVYGCAQGEEATTLVATGAPSCIPQPVMIPGNTPMPPTMRETSVMPWQELPDYRPPFAQGAVRPDADGNLWIRTIPVKGGPAAPAVYDLVNRRGELFDRLQLPPGYTLLGFGAGRVVYLSMRDANGIHVARVRLK
jgi:hypothetical protein